MPRYCFIERNPAEIRAFTLVEMLVVIAIIAILAALLMPGLKRSLDLSRQVSCSNNQKQLGIGIFSYSNDFNMYLPPANSTGPDYFGRTNYKDYTNILSDAGYIPVAPDQWNSKYQGYVKSGIWCCTALANFSFGGGIAPVVAGHSIMMYGSSMRVTALRRPSQLLLLGDSIMLHGGIVKSYYELTCPSCRTWSSIAREANTPNGSNLHYGGGTMVFVDGHTEWRDYTLWRLSTQTGGDNPFAHGKKY